MKAKHADIAHAFGSDAGARLMRKDSDLAEQVVLDMIRQGVVPLSVHDSYIVPADQGGIYTPKWPLWKRDKSSR